MESRWRFQIRIGVSAELSAALRKDPSCKAHAPLRELLRRHNATLKCQFDAFADYVSEAQSAGPDKYPLYQWTKATLEKPEKRAKYLESFTVYVDGEEVYGEEIAESLQSDLSALVGNDGIKSVVKFDTNPANNPQPPAREP